MKVLLTGATGFVGQHLLTGLASRGFDVRALVMTESEAQTLRAAGYEPFVGDLTNPSSLDGCCDGVEAVIHTACAVASTFDAGQSAKEQFLAVNRDGRQSTERDPGLRPQATGRTNRANLGFPGGIGVDSSRL